MHRSRAQIRSGPLGLLCRRTRASALKGVGFRRENSPVDILILRSPWSGPHSPDCAARPASPRSGRSREELARSRRARRSAPQRPAKSVRDQGLAITTILGARTASHPFPISSCIDDDGQELRYHVNRDGETSLKGESLANIVVIRESLKELASVIDGLMHRTIDFVAERMTGTHTSRCSRADLREITGMIAPLAEWCGEAFTAAKDAVKERFALSNTQFSKAIDVIKANREFYAMIGGETDLPYLLDDEVMLVVEQWRILHPDRAEKEPEVVQGGRFRSAGLITNIKKRRECVDALSGTITSHEAADLEALFYLGRGAFFPELFEERAATYLEFIGDDAELRARTGRLLDKTNLIACLERGARRAGRRALAERLSAPPAEQTPTQDEASSQARE